MGAHSIENSDLLSKYFLQSHGCYVVELNQFNSMLLARYSDKASFNFKLFFSSNVWNAEMSSCEYVYQLNLGIEKFKEEIPKACFQ